MGTLFQITFTPIESCVQRVAIKNNIDALDVFDNKGILRRPRPWYVNHRVKIVAIDL
jgi:hypothetical protein